MTPQLYNCRKCGDPVYNADLCPSCEVAIDPRWEKLKACVAQKVEQGTHNPLVDGATPSARTGDVAKLADAADLKSVPAKGAGAIPAIPTIKKPEPFKWYAAEKFLPPRQKPVLVAYHPGGLGRPASRRFIIAVWGGDTWHFKPPYVKYKPSRISHWLQISFPVAEKDKRKNAAPEEKQYYRYLDKVYESARGLPDGQENSTLPKAGSIPAGRAIPRPAKRRARLLA